ncbi:protein HID1 [Rhipicephalus sanguineus]|uniref:protein HID1 n=1 Tax=Rhipicephalus sanguineus TaxID=34632 RepID=UPI0018953ED6|nr:protein HID1 [Rhipicephalus sanguineus]
MGNTDSKLNFRKAVIQLTTKTQPIEARDEAFWEQFWGESGLQSVQDVFALVPAAEIRALREEAPSNLATLCYKAVERLVRAADSLCNTAAQQTAVLNCVRLLTRILPYIFEDSDWRGFFWSSLPGSAEDDAAANGGAQTESLAQSLITALCDLLFCPDFTVSCSKKSGPEQPEEPWSLDSCEYIWASGVGFAHSPPCVPQHDQNRLELLKLLLTCFSQTMYLTSQEAHQQPNKWIHFFTSADNRHALPLFTSLLNIVCGYDPVGYGLPFNHLLFADHREPLVEVALQLLVVTLDHDFRPPQQQNNAGSNGAGPEGEAWCENLFINYLSRIHREEDFAFVLKGFTRLLNNPLMRTYLPHSAKRIACHQELLVFFWKMCDYNKKFLFYVLKSSEVLDILVPTLYHLNDARADQSRVGLVHIGVFILLLLSGERNFGVRLNKPYCASVPMDIPIFTGTHADLLIIVFHKIITTGHQRLQPLFDCLLTIIVNVSPYLKTLSMVASTKLLHLLEAFSTPWFLYSNPTNHHLVFFLLEIFNNIIQYQFDGNSNLVYTVIRKRHVFHALANLPTEQGTIERSLSRRSRSKGPTPSVPTTPSEEPSPPPTTPTAESETQPPPEEAPPSSSLNATLAATPRLEKMTEQAHPVSSPTGSTATSPVEKSPPRSISKGSGGGLVRAGSNDEEWRGPTPEWVASWKQKLPLQTIMRLLQVLVPQVEKICIDKGLTDESEILKFLQHGTLVGLLPVPHPILIRKYQSNAGTTMWFRTYMWGLIYLRNVDPPIWYDTEVRLFEIQRL